MLHAPCVANFNNVKNKSVKLVRGQFSAMPSKQNVKMSKNMKSIIMEVGNTAHYAPDTLLSTLPLLTNLLSL